MKRHLLFMFLGGCLVLAGYLVGQSGATFTPVAQAVTVMPEKFSPFKSGNPALVTQSQDGTVIHFWAMRGNFREELWHRALPAYIGSAIATKPPEQ